jgi:hypothetical protein
MNEIIINIIDKVLLAKLELKSLYEQWPEDMAKNQFYESIFDDIERAVEHQSGNIFDNSINMERWVNSSDYKRLLKIKDMLKMGNVPK